jgi:hypothetical protein
MLWSLYVPKGTFTMKQADLNRAVARATGESVNEIERMGFGLVLMPILPQRPKANVHRLPKPLPQAAIAAQQPALRSA